MMQRTSGSAATASGWSVSRRRGSAATLVADVDGAGGTSSRRILLCETTNAAFVLGSTQPESDVDPTRAAAAGVEVVRRRAGGGGVLVAPGAQLWLDVFVPARDPLWSADVGRAFHWLGVAAASAIGATTGAGPVVHEQGLVGGRWSSVLCFSGLGAGEVCIDGRKVLGISQRRDRAGAWFRAMVLLRHVPEESTGLLALGDAERAEATECLRAAAAAVEAGPAVLEHALVEAIVDAG